MVVELSSFGVYPALKWGDHEIDDRLSYYVVFELKKALLREFSYIIPFKDSLFHHMNEKMYSHKFLHIKESMFMLFQSETAGFSHCLLSGPPGTAVEETWTPE